MLYPHHRVLVSHLFRLSGLPPQKAELGEGRKTCQRHSTPHASAVGWARMLELDIFREIPWREQCGSRGRYWGGRETAVVGSGQLRLPCPKGTRKPGQWAQGRVDKWSNAIYAPNRPVSGVLWPCRPVDEAADRDQYGFSEKYVCDGRV